MNRREKKDRHAARRVQPPTAHGRSRGSPVQARNQMRLQDYQQGQGGHRKAVHRETVATDDYGAQPQACRGERARHRCLALPAMAA